MTASSRILRDNTAEKARIAELEARIAELEAQKGASTEPSVSVQPYTPKQGVNAGKTDNRLFIKGAKLNGKAMFPVVITRDACAILASNPEFYETVCSFAKTGK